MKLLVVSALFAPFVLSFSQYRQSIPNGANVPGWPGVGHNSASGGGSRNVFGQAFASAGRSWTTALCEADSDGDGQSNGLELGDPCCTWTTSSTPDFTTAISHPALSGQTTTRSMPSCGGAEEDDVTPADDGEATADDGGSEDDGGSGGGSSSADDGGSEDDGGSGGGSSSADDGGSEDDGGSGGGSSSADDGGSEDDAGSGDDAGSEDDAGGDSPSPSPSPSPSSFSGGSESSGPWLAGVWTAAAGGAVALAAMLR